MAHFCMYSLSCMKQWKWYGKTKNICDLFSKSTLWSIRPVHAHLSLCCHCLIFYHDWSDIHHQIESPDHLKFTLVTISWFLELVAPIDLPISPSTVICGGQVALERGLQSLNLSGPLNWLLSACKDNFLANLYSLKPSHPTVHCGQWQFPGGLCKEAVPYWVK